MSTASTGATAEQIEAAAKIRCETQDQPDVLPGWKTPCSACVFEVTESAAALVPPTHAIYAVADVPSEEVVAAIRRRNKHWPIDRTDADDADKIDAWLDGRSQ